MVENLQSAVLGAGEFIEDAIFVLFIVLINIIDLIGWIFTMQSMAVPPRLSEAFGFSTQALPIPVPLENITGLVILQKVLEAPWMGIFTNTICFALALLNNTWSLTLLITNAKLNDSDLAYFQMGYIFDWLRAASLCLGQVFAALDPALEFAIAGFFDILFWAVQIAIEISIAQARRAPPPPYGIVHALSKIFYLAYSFLNYFLDFGIDATLFGASFYCQANNTAAASAYLNLLNNSAAFAILVGCNASTQAFPIDTLGATCEDNPAGCIVLSTYRFLVEVVNVLELTLCAIPQLVTFSPNLTVAVNISIDGVIREGLHVGRCLRVLLYDLHAFAPFRFSSGPAKNHSNIICGQCVSGLANRERSEDVWQEVSQDRRARACVLCSPSARSRTFFPAFFAIRQPAEVPQLCRVS